LTEIKGIIINPGLKTGRAKIIRKKEYNIKIVNIDRAEVEKEIRQFEAALQKIEAELAHLLESNSFSEKDKDILLTHKEIIRDPDLHAKVSKSIREELFSAAHSVLQVFSEYIRFFEGIENSFYRQRISDYKDMANRLLGSILGETANALPAKDKDSIVLATEISPSQVTNLAKSGITAYCSEHGSYNSHCAILTRALNITALTNLSRLLEIVKDGDLLILDGINGRLLVNPDDATILQYKELENKYSQTQAGFRSIKDRPSETKSGRRIGLTANMELPHEIETILDLGCNGIGLFRTEFLYISKNALPTEEQQVDIYSQIVSKLSPYPVTIRTFDLGGDKLSHLLHFSKEENPYLGCRGIRFSLLQKELFKAQVRAILQASVFGKAQIMFPMVIDVDDFRKAKKLVLDCMEELDKEGKAFDREIALGVMIEIPSAALMAEELAREADFFSIGTNDLVQYTLAVDRNNENISQMYIQHHPAVLQLIQKTLTAAKKHGKHVAVCGEMASTDEYIPLLIGMGVDELSINPNHFFQSKAIVLNCDAKLDAMLATWDYSASLKETEELIYQTLKPYFDR